MKSVTSVTSLSDENNFEKKKQNQIAWRGNKKA